MRANYVGQRENPKIITTTNSKYIDPYLIYHGSLTYSGDDGFYIQFIVKNISDEVYYHTSNRDPDRYRQSQGTILLSVGYSLKSIKL